MATKGKYYLFDDTLSLDAKGLLGMMMTLPNGSNIPISELLDMCVDDDECVMSALEELKMAGLVTTNDSSTLSVVR